MIMTPEYVRNVLASIIYLIILLSYLIYLYFEYIQYGHLWVIVLSIFTIAGYGVLLTLPMYGWRKAACMGALSMSIFLVFWICFNEWKYRSGSLGMILGYVGAIMAIYWNGYLPLMKQEPVMVIGQTVPIRFVR